MFDQSSQESQNYAGSRKEESHKNSVFLSKTTELQVPQKCVAAFSSLSMVKYEFYQFCTTWFTSLFVSILSIFCGSETKKKRQKL